MPSQPPHGIIWRYSDMQRMHPKNAAHYLNAMNLYPSTVYKRDTYTVLSIYTNWKIKRKIKPHAFNWNVFSGGGSKRFPPIQVNSPTELALMQLLTTLSKRPQKDSIVALIKHIKTKESTLHLLRRSIIQLKARSPENTMCLLKWKTSIHRQILNLPFPH